MIRRWLLLALVVLFAGLVTLLWNLPASVGDRVLDHLSNGRARLADTSGTVWKGRGKVVLVDVAAERQQTGPVLAGLVLPGQLSWQVRIVPLMIGLVDVTLGLDGINTPLRLNGSFSEIRGSGGTLSLPAVDLGRLGSPWNTIRPSAAVGLQWDAFTIRQGAYEGRMSIELRDAASSMTPVRPLGTYRIDVDSKTAGTKVNLQTLSGPLKLSGSGQWDKRYGLRFSAYAEPDASERDRLQGFLALIGRREGDKTVIKIGA